MDSLSKGTETIGNLVHPWDTLTLFVCLTSAVWGETLHSTMGEHASGPVCNRFLASWNQQRAEGVRGFYM